MTKQDVKKIKIAPELSDLIVYCISVPFKGQTLEEVSSFASEAGGRCETMSSLSEEKAKSVMLRGKHRPAFQRYHAKQITRIYPKVILN